MAKKTTTKKKVSGARIEPKKNNQGKINYKIIGRNGKLLADVRQGFERKAGMVKNIESLKKFFAGEFKVLDID